MKGSSRFKGQALVELALGLPLLLLLIFGVMELGRAFFVKIALTNAAREGANYLLYNRDSLAQNIADAKWRVINEVADTGLVIDPTEITVKCLKVSVNLDTNEIISEVEDPACSGRSTVEVTVTNQHHVTIFGYLTGPIHLESNARMVLP